VGSKAVRATICLDTYWRYQAERLATYYRRLRSTVGPWTSDPIIAAHRFTTPYRAADRVSQYLIREVQYGEGADVERGQGSVDVFFRTMLFKLFNTVSTWELLERELGQIEYQTFDWSKAEAVLDAAFASKATLYSAAYIMPDVPKFGGGRKHRNHLRLLYTMIQDGLPHKLQAAPTLKRVYELLLAYPGLGPFLAFQFAIDLNYSTLIDHGEDSFVVCGPGALDGISKCFTDIGRRKPEDVVKLMFQWQEHEYARLGLEFPGLFGRRMQLIDCQGGFCEISKYSRVAHPELEGVGKRQRIKQLYRPTEAAPMPVPFFPPKWGINELASSACVADASVLSTNLSHSGGAGQ
jgi:hypothetical protein